MSRGVSRRSHHLNLSTASGSGFEPQDVLRAPQRAHRISRSVVPNLSHPCCQPAGEQRWVGSLVLCGHHLALLLSESVTAALARAVAGAVLLDS